MNYNIVLFILKKIYFIQGESATAVTTSCLHASICTRTHNMHGHENIHTLNRKQ